MEINPAAITDRNPQNQNLVELSKVGIATRPHGFWRQLSLDVLGFATALFFGYSYFIYLARGISPWYVFSGLLAFIVTSTLHMFLSKEIWRRVFGIFVETVLIVAAFVFLDPFQVVLVAAGLVFFLLLWAYLGGRSEADNEVEIRFFKATRGTIGKITSAAILFLLIVYAPQAQGSGAFVSRSSFKSFFSWSAEILNNIYPGMTFNGTFGDFASSFINAEFSDNPSFASLAPSAKSAAIEQATANFNENISRTLKMQPSPNMLMSDVAYNYIVATLTGWQSAVPGEFTIIWVVVLFLTFRFIGIIFVFLAQLVLMLFYEILLAAGFMKIEGIPQTKESLQY